MQRIHRESDGSYISDVPLSESGRGRASSHTIVIDDPKNTTMLTHWEIVSDVPNCPGSSLRNISIPNRNIA